MEHEEGVKAIEVIAKRVKELRGRQGYTAQELADKLCAEGVPWERATVTKLETKRRQNVSVVELLTLAKVLNVAPAHLLVPLDDAQPFKITPKSTVDAGRARAWVRGALPLPGTDVRIFRTEVPLDEFVPRTEAELAELLGSWGNADVEAWKRRNPEAWEGHVPRSGGTADG